MPINRFNHISRVAVVTPIDHPNSVRNRCVIEVFGGVYVLSLCFLEFSVLDSRFTPYQRDFSVSVGAFVIGPSQISSVFSLFNLLSHLVWLRITDEGSVPEIKWCIHLRRNFAPVCFKFLYNPNFIRYS